MRGRKKEQKMVKSRCVCVCVRARKQWGETGVSAGFGLSLFRHDWLCQEEISSPHIPLPSHLQGPGKSKRSEETLPPPPRRSALNRDSHEKSDSCFYSKCGVKYHTLSKGRYVEKKDEDKGCERGFENVGFLSSSEVVV